MRKLFAIIVLFFGLLFSASSFASPANPNVGELQFIQKVSNLLQQYPSNSAQFIHDYIGVDPRKVDMNAFNHVIATQNPDQIFDHTLDLYQHKDAINSGYYSYADYYNSYYHISTTTAYAPEASSGSILGVTPAAAYTIGAVAVLGGVAAVAAGDGGGGGGNYDGPPPSNSGDAFGRDAIADTSTPSTFVTTEFDAYPYDALNREKAQYAYAKGLTGQGVKVGIYDFFNYNSNTAGGDYTGNVSYSKLPANSAADDCQVFSQTTFCTHGETVAARLASVKNDSGIQGMAYNASLMLESVYSGTFADLTSHGAKVINVSLGCIGSCSGEWSSNFTVAKLNDALVTVATGNDYASEPGDPADFASSYDYYVLAVGAIETDNSMTYSNKCGTQKNYCLVAYSPDGTSFAAPQVAGAAAIIRQGWPFLTAKQTAQILLSSATDIGAAGIDATYGHGVLNLQAAVQPIGTNLALTGSGLAVNYTNSSVNQNQGSAFGNAFTNPGNAHGGVVTVDSFGRDFSVPTSDSTHVVNNPFLTPEKLRSIGEKKSFDEMKVSDEMSLKFSDGTDQNGQPDIMSLAEYKVNNNTKYRLGFSSEVDNLTTNDLQKFNKSSFISSNAFDNTFLKFSDNNEVISQQIEYSLTPKITTRISSIYSRNNDTDDFHLTEEQVTSNYSSNMFEAIYSPTESFSLDLKNGYTHEPDSLLGSRFYGSFDIANGSNTFFNGLDMSYDFAENWNLFGSYNLGFTKASPSATSAFSEISNIVSDSFAFALTRSEVFGDDSLSFSIAQPTRVISGNATGLTQSVDQTTGAVSITGFNQNLSPTGRTMLYQSAYEKQVSPKLGVNVAVEYADQPDHDASKEADKVVLGKIKYKLN